MRRFVAADRLGAFVEVYSNRSRLTAGDVTLAAALARPDGTTVARGTAVPVGEHLGSSRRDGRWPFLVALDLVGLPPGPYVLTVEASAVGVERPVQRRVPVQVGEH